MVKTIAPKGCHLLITGLLAFPAAAAPASPYGTDRIPFGLLSPWNVGIGSGAQWGSAGDADVAALRGLTGTLNGAVWGQPIYFATGGDPMTTITNSDPLQPVPPQTLHVPAGAQPAAGTDRHMAFYDATQPTRMWSYFGCNPGGGTISCALGGVWDVTGDGIQNTVSPGSDYNFAVGTITDFDLSQGTIAHALRFALSADASRAPGPTWTSNVPWPNTHIDYNGPSMYTGQITAGVTIGIPAGTDLSKLGLSQGGMMLARALQNYGAIWRDSGGSHQVVFYTTPESDSNPLIQQARGDLPRIVPQLSIMRNQGAETVNGGGSYQRAETAAAIYYPNTTPPQDLAQVQDEIAKAEAALGQAPVQRIGTLPAAPPQDQLAAIQAAIAKLQAAQTQPPAAILDLAPHLPVATPGTGQVVDAKGVPFSITPEGSVMARGEYVPGGGETLAVTSVDGVIWGQDASRPAHHWFIWNGQWWQEQTGTPR